MQNSTTAAHNGPSSHHSLPFVTAMFTAPADARIAPRELHWSPMHRAILSERKITRVDLIYQPVKDIIFLGGSWCYGYYLAACQAYFSNRKSLTVISRDF